MPERTFGEGAMDELVLLLLIVLGMASVLSAAWLHFGR
jgi:hypothetical protein